MTTPLMTLHVATHREALSASGMSAPEGFLTRMTVRVDAEAGWAGERLIAHTTHVPVL